MIGETKEEQDNANKLQTILGPIIYKCGLNCKYPVIMEKSYRFYYNNPTTVDLCLIEVNRYLKNNLLTNKFNVLSSTSKIGDNVIIIQIKDKYFNTVDLDNMLTLINMTRDRNE